MVEGGHPKNTSKSWSGSKLLDGWVKIISMAEKKEAKDIEDETKQNILAKRKRLADQKGGARKKKKTQKVQNQPVNFLNLDVIF